MRVFYGFTERPNSRRVYGLALSLREVLKEKERMTVLLKGMECFLE